MAAVGKDIELEKEAAVADAAADVVFPFEVDSKGDVAVDGDGDDLSDTLQKVSCISDGEKDVRGGDEDACSMYWFDAANEEGRTVGAICEPEKGDDDDDDDTAARDDVNNDEKDEGG